MSIINAKTLRADLRRILHRVRGGERFTVVYRSQPVCELIPIGSGATKIGKLEEDPLYRAPAVGRSRDGRSSEDHDAILYGRRR